MTKFKLTDGIFYDTRTGTAQIVSDPNSPTELYAILVQSGHCGKGYYMPQLMSVEAYNKEMAIEIARNSGRIKSSRKNAVLAVTKISPLERYTINYINSCDPYYTSVKNSESIPYVQEGRIAMQAAVDYTNTGNPGSIPLDAVKTADKYSEKHVFQRLLAPSFYGSKLIYPRTINLRAALDEYFYQSTIEYGLKQRRGALIGFYYQLYGINNRLGINYSNGQLNFTYGDTTIYVPAPTEAIPHLEEYKAKFEEEERIKAAEEERRKEREQTHPFKQKSAIERFRERSQKHKKMISSDDDVM